MPGDAPFELSLGAEPERAVKRLDADLVAPSNEMAAIAVGFLWVTGAQPTPAGIATSFGVPDGTARVEATVPMSAPPLLQGFGVPEDAAPIETVTADPGPVRIGRESDQFAPSAIVGGTPVSPAAGPSWRTPDRATPALSVPLSGVGEEVDGEKNPDDVTFRSLARGIVIGSGSAGLSDLLANEPIAHTAAPTGADFGQGAAEAGTGPTLGPTRNLEGSDRGKAGDLTWMLARRHQGPDPQLQHAPAPKPDDADPALEPGAGIGAGLPDGSFGVEEAVFPAPEAAATDPTQIRPATPAERFWIGKLQQHATRPDGDTALLMKGKVPDPAPVERDLTNVSSASVATVGVMEAIHPDLPPPRTLQGSGLQIMGNADPAADHVADRVLDPVATGSGWLQPVGQIPHAAATPQAASVPLLSGQIVALMTQAADGRTEIALSPDELGHVRLHLQTDAQNPNRMVVHLTFDRPDTLDLFRRHADQLAEAIRAAGYGEATLSFGQSGAGPERGSDTGADNAGTSDHSMNPPVFPADDRPSALASKVQSGLPRQSELAVLDLRL